MKWPINVEKLPACQQIALPATTSTGDCEVTTGKMPIPRFIERDWRQTKKRCPKTLLDRHVAGIRFARLGSPFILVVFTQLQTRQQDNLVRVPDKVTGGV